MTVDNVVGFAEGARQGGGITRILQRASDNTFKAMPITGKWSSVNGPMSSAMATLIDLDWGIVDIFNWRDPEGHLWTLDYEDPMLPDILKEVLMVHTSRFIWKNYAAHHYAGIDVVPDFTAYRMVKKVLRKTGDARQLYFLESIVQGSCVGLADKHVHINEDNVPVCDHCQQVVTGCAFRHFSYYCSAINSLELAGIEASSHVIEQAQVVLEVRPALWLRGLLPLDVPDPLVQDYSYISSFTSLDVTGKILAGDGSGGRNSKDFRTRRCGFGLVVIEPNIVKIVHLFKRILL